MCWVCFLKLLGWFLEQLGLQENEGESPEY